MFASCSTSRFFTILSFQYSDLSNVVNGFPKITISRNLEFCVLHYFRESWFLSFWIFECCHFSEIAILQNSNFWVVRCFKHLYFSKSWFMVFVFPCFRNSHFFQNADCWVSHFLGNLNFSKSRSLNYSIIRNSWFSKNWVWVFSFFWKSCFLKVWVSQYFDFSKTVNEFSENTSSQDIVFCVCICSRILISRFLNFWMLPFSKITIPPRTKFWVVRCFEHVDVSTYWFFMFSTFPFFENREFSKS